MVFFLSENQKNPRLFLFSRWVSLENKKKQGLFGFLAKNQKTRGKPKKNKKTSRKPKKTKKMSQTQDSPQNFGFFAFLVFSRFFWFQGQNQKSLGFIWFYWQKPKNSRKTKKNKTNSRKPKKNKKMSQTQDSPQNFCFFLFFGFLEVFFGFRAKTKTALGLFGFLIKNQKTRGKPKKTKKNLEKTKKTKKK